MIIKNKNNKKAINKKLVIIICSILLIILIIISTKNYVENKKQQKFLQQETQRVKQYTALTDFKTIQEVALYLNCKIIKQEDSILYMELPVKPYEDGTSNKTLYENLIQYMAYVLEYKDFVILDNKNNTSIVVYCDEQAKQIGKYYINEIENYFDVKQSEQNVENINIKSPIKVNISSKQLQEIINNNWKTENINLGSMETTYRNYNIYFDEGYEIRKINGKVFNIVFTDKYNNSIINNITTKSTKEEIQKSLGAPHFEVGDIIGYKCENMYVFAYDNEISIYPKEKYNTEKIAQSIEKYKSGNDVKTFIQEVKNEWKDYDKYEYDTDFVILQYSLKGICIRFDGTTKKGIVFYNNYTGKACGETTFEQYINKETNIPSNIYIENTDLVFQTEIDRINSKDDNTQTHNYTTEATLNTSSEFKVIAKKSTSGEYEIRFVSIGSKYPNSQLRQKIISGVWKDDYNFEYSVAGGEKYSYNAKTRTYTTIE